MPDDGADCGHAPHRRATEERVAAAPARGKRYDDYQVPAGTPLVVRLRNTLDSASVQLDDPVRATLLSPVTQEVSS